LVSDDLSRNAFQDGLCADTGLLLSIPSSRCVYVSATASAPTIVTLRITGGTSPSPYLLMTDLKVMISSNSTSLYAGTQYMRYIDLGYTPMVTTITEPTPTNYLLIVWIGIPAILFVGTLAVINWCSCCKATDGGENQPVKKRPFTLLTIPLSIYGFVTAVLYVILLAGNRQNGLQAHFIAYIILMVIHFLFNAIAALVLIYHETRVESVRAWSQQQQPVFTGMIMIACLNLDVYEIFMSRTIASWSIFNAPFSQRIQHQYLPLLGVIGTLYLVCTWYIIKLVSVCLLWHDCCI
jgi:hypothetical protein